MPTLPEYADLLKPALTEAAAELEQAEAEVEAAQAKVKLAKAKSRQVEIAMSALKGGDRTAGHQHARKGRNAWKPKKETMDKVAKAITMFSDGFTEDQVIEATGFSEATVNRAVRIMRDERKVRLAGKQPGTQKNLYKPIVVPETRETTEAVA